MSLSVIAGFADRMYVIPLSGSGNEDFQGLLCKCMFIFMLMAKLKIKLRSSGTIYANKHCGL